MSKLAVAARVGRRPLMIAASALLGLAFVSSAMAQEATTEEQLADIIGAVDTLWLMLAAFMVFLMQAGFALVEAGFIRAKNATNVLMKNVLDCCMGGLLFWAVGWGIAYGVSGEASNGFIGDGQFFLKAFPNDGYASWIFQFAFAATAATIVSGAMAERTKFSAYLIYTACISGFIYPVVVHWGWDSNGWLTAFKDDPIGTNGYIDFAGSGIVHAVGGTAALVGAFMVGPRLGKYGKDGTINAIPGHNISIAVLGMFILWFGWYGFNPGSTLALSGGFAALAAKVAVTTTLSAVAGGAVAALYTRARTGRYDLGLTVNGVLGGLVGITAGCSVVDPWAAIVIGAIASLIVIGGVALLDNLRIDDPVGAAPVHCFAGIWGVLAVGLFASQDGIGTAYAETDQYGLLLGGGVEQLGIQALGISAIVGWTAVTSFIMFGLIKMTIGLRVSEDEEIRGLDLYEHGIDAYPDFGPTGSGVFAPAGSAAATRAAEGTATRPATAPGGGQ